MSSRVRLKAGQDPRVGRTVAIEAYAALAEGETGNTRFKVDIASIKSQNSRIFAFVDNPSTGRRETVEITDKCQWYLPEEAGQKTQLIQAYIVIPSMLYISQHLMTIKECTMVLNIHDPIANLDKYQGHNITLPV